MLRIFSCLFLFFSFIPAAFGILKPAIELHEDAVILLKDFSVRAYDDTQHSANPKFRVDSVEEIINGVRWSKRPFYMSNPRLPSVGAVYYNPHSGAVAVVFHGSYWLRNWKSNFTAAHRSASDLTNGLSGMVHKGFSDLVLDSYSNMVSAIEAFVKTPLTQYAQNGGEIRLTGHSLGGALAMLSGTVLTFQNNFQENAVKIVAFSAPRGVIGDFDFVRVASRKLSFPNILNFSTKGDPVPYDSQHLVSPLYPYAPFGMNIEISPVEKMLSHYREAAAPKDLDEARQHPLWGVVKDVFWYTIGGHPPTPQRLVEEYVTVFHGAPSNEAIKTALGYAVFKYKSSGAVEDAGEFSLAGSVERNALWRSLYNYLSPCRR